MERTPEPSTVTYTELQEGSTFYSTEILEGTAEAITVTFTELLDGSPLYRTSIVISTPDPRTLTHTEWREASTAYSLSFVEHTPEPLVLTYTELREGTTIYSTLVSESTPPPLTITHTTPYLDQTPSPDFITQTLTENGQTMTSIIERTRDAISATEPTPEPATITLTLVQDGTTVYETSLLECTIISDSPVTVLITRTETIIISRELAQNASTVAPDGDSLTASNSGTDATGNMTALLTADFSMVASTIYTCISGADQESSGPANANVATVTSTMYETLDASECPANFSISTVTSFVYGSDAVSGDETLSSSYGFGMELAAQTVTSLCTDRQSRLAAPMS